MIEIGDNASYVLSSEQVAERLDAGGVAINGAQHEAMAPFGGVEQSSIDKEVWGSRA